MKTPAEWLDEILADNNKFNAWLQRQYIGEMLAACRLFELANDSVVGRASHVLNQIADDEARHANWIYDLLAHYGVDIPAVPNTLDDNDRYWNCVLPYADTLDNKYAAGAHAERMRLARIELLAHDSRVPKPVSAVFALILKDERMHAAAFEALASDEALTRMLEHHEAGLAMLGLTID